MNRIVFWIVVSLLIFGCSAAAAEEIPEWVKSTKISGYFFGDAYGVVSHHDPAIEGENGFWFRRIYLTFDKKVSENTDFRLRFEANSPGDFSTSKNLEPYLKDLYVRWKPGRHEVSAGLSSAPTWDLIEDRWGYRHVEKTPLDLYKWGSSRDIGVAMKGAVDKDNRVRYHVMLGNGEGAKSETDAGKKIMAAVSYHPAEAWTFQLYGDAENRSGQTDRITWQAFAGYGRERGRIGFQYAGQIREVSSTEELDLGLASIYGAVKVWDRCTVLGRVDRTFDPIPGGDKVDYISFDPTARVTFVVVGLDVALSEKVSLIPNIEAAAYDAVDDGPDPDNDLIARLTLFVRM